MKPSEIFESEESSLHKAFKELIEDDNNTETLKAGYVLKSKSGEYSIVLKVVGNAYVQDAFDGYWSTQSRNDNRGVVVHIWDGRFYGKRSLSEIDVMYDEILAPDEKTIVETFNKINN